MLLSDDGGFIHKCLNKISVSVENELSIKLRQAGIQSFFLKLISNFIEITLRHGCSPVNLLHIFRTSFLKNTSARLLLRVDCIIFLLEEASYQLILVCSTLHSVILPQEKIALTRTSISFLSEFVLTGVSLNLNVR